MPHTRDAATTGKHNVYLVGMPGAGKSTIGKALARRLRLEFCDADEEIVRHTGVPVATIFELEGEAGFRAREAHCIGNLAARTNLVVATGGGAVLSETNRTVLRASGVVIYLHASLADLFARTRRDSRRPLLRAADPQRVLEELLRVREPLYRGIADLVIATGRQSVGRLAGDIVEALVGGKLWPPDQAPANGQVLAPTAAIGPTGPTEPSAPECATPS